MAVQKRSPNKSKRNSPKGEGGVLSDRKERSSKVEKIVGQPDRLHVYVSRTIQVKQYEPITYIVSYSTDLREQENSEEVLDKISKLVENNLIKRVKPILNKNKEYKNG